MLSGETEEAPGTVCVAVIREETEERRIHASDHRAACDEAGARAMEEQARGAKARPVHHHRRQGKDIDTVRIGLDKIMTNHKSQY